MTVKTPKIIQPPASKRKPGNKASKRPKAPKRPALLSEEAIQKVFQKLHEANPDPKGELEYVNAYTLLVAVVLSAQATDAGVNRATRPLFRVADTPIKMIALGEDRVRDYVKTIGLFRNKAKNVIALSEKLVNDYGSQVPDDREALESLPGVGRKTANVVLNIAFGQPTMAVDTHVFRVANRIGLSHGKNPVKVEEDLLREIPEQYALHAHHWLILLGRYICKARKPECWRCPVRGLCLYPDKSPPPAPQALPRR